METAGYSRFARHAFSSMWPGKSFLDPEEVRLARSRYRHREGRQRSADSTRARDSGARPA
jgi:hypothetical protein